jgi:flagellar biosynthesis/type III secretory pathway protein FliH
MRRAPGWVLLPVMILALSGIAQANSWSKERVYRAGYEQGYLDGLRRGEYLYRSGSPRGADPRDYRDDTGYVNWMGHKGEYRKGYREGYRVGYHEYGYGRAARRDSRHGSRYPGGYPSYPDAHRYPGNSYWGGNSYRDYGHGRNGYDVAYERGMDRGYHEGLEKGREDYRKHRDYDPHRHRKYRNADDGYKSSYGDRRDYEAGYRRAFEDGYRQAYRPQGLPSPRPL